jgi:adenosylcobinamide-GDP ribazoletransferase
MRAALGLLTTVGGARPPTPRALPWFPIVGLMAGGAVGAAWWAMSEIAPPAVAAATAIAVDLALTGMLHADAVADAADGLLPPLAGTERRLEVMADPRPGSFGVVAVVTVLLTRFAVLASVEPDVAALAGLWAAARAAMAVAVTTMPAARPGGLADAFRGGRPGVPAAIGLAVGAALAGWALIGLVLAAGAIVWLSHRRLGGVTGDVVGAAGMVGETAGLVVLAVVTA